METRPFRKLAASAGLEAELAALRALEGDRCGQESLLLWEAADACVVLPRSGAPTDFVLDSADPGIPVLRRESGGGAALLGPGCLNYALALSLDRRPELLDVEQSYARILDALAAALPLADVRVHGADLVWRDRKFGGSAQRRTRATLLHHGTILYDFDLQRIGELMREPARQPPYRRGRTHIRFLTNAPISLDSLSSAFEQFAAVLRREPA